MKKKKDLSYTPAAPTWQVALKASGHKTFLTYRLINLIYISILRKQRDRLVRINRKDKKGMRMRLSLYCD